MTRRKFFLSGLAAGAGRPCTITVRVDRRGPSIAPDFMGLGYEITSVATPGLLSPTNKIYAQLVRTLASQGVIRIGGNTADQARSPMNGAALRDLGGFLKLTGWKLIWALNLGTGTYAEAVAEAHAVIAAAGDRLLAFEIGNEPDFFPMTRHRNAGYSYENWLSEYRRYKTALRAAIPGVPLAGPDAAVATDWVSRFAADEGADAVLLTRHYYIEAAGPGSTIQKLLAPDPNLQPTLAVLNAAAKKAAVPYRVCEVNSFSSGGRPGVSDTMAAALWVLDYMFTLAANGCAGVNMETGVNQLGFISSYSPIADDNHGHYTAAPEYYGMLAFSQAGKGRLLRTEIESAPSGSKSWATRSEAGAIAVTLINKGNTDAAVTVNVPGTRASLIRLSAPSADAKTGITLGGATVSPAGVWKPLKTEELTMRTGACAVRLPAFSAAIVQIA